MQTLPDYLREGLDIVLVGLNPSAYSARTGHYFANPRNRFWRALNRSGLVGVKLAPEMDYSLLDHGIGFTDVVKRPTPQASGLVAEDYRRWAPVLRAKLEEYRPLIAAFHGLTAYRHYLRYGERSTEAAELGLQERMIGVSRLFVVPNPSPANARYSVEDLIGWYEELRDLRDSLKSS